MRRLSELIFLPVVTRDGRSLGRVLEVRSAGEPEHGLPPKVRAVSELVCGTKGLWEQLGLKKAETQVIAWSAVVALEEDRLVVRLD